MSSRVIIPEIIDEAAENRGKYGRDHAHNGRPNPFRFQPPAVGLGAMLRALGAGVVLVIAASAIILLGFTIMLVFGAIFAVLGLVALLRAKFGKPSSTVVFRSTRTGGSRNNVFFLERVETRRPSNPGGDGAE
jgi:hypothetical protein